MLNCAQNLIENKVLHTNFCHALLEKIKKVIVNYDATWWMYSVRDINWMSAVSERLSRVPASIVTPSTIKLIQIFRPMQWQDSLIKTLHDYNSFMICMSIQKNHTIFCLFVSPVVQTDVFVHGIACSACHREQKSLF